MDFIKSSQHVEPFNQVILLDIQEDRERSLRCRCERSSSPQKNGRTKVNRVRDHSARSKYSKYY